jgi:hypothetical protein
MRLLFATIVLLFTQTAFSAEYSGCSDPKYIKYVHKRLSFYKKIDKESYQKAQEKLIVVPFDKLNRGELELYLFGNTVLSARFDTIEVTLRNIKAYEALQLQTPSYMRTGDTIHQINIAKGWLALKAGDEDEAIRYLIASTKNQGSPVLGSFGPDTSLIRELYQRGKKEAVLEYLKQAQSFWNTDSANEYVNVWRKMIKNNCSIQFQFYDTTSIKDLGLK